MLTKITTGLIAVAAIGAVAAIAPTLDANDPHLQPRSIVLQTEAQAAPNTRLAEQDAAAIAAADALREIYEQEDFDIMRGIVMEPEE